MSEQIIKIKHNKFVIILEKTDLTDENWTDITIENTKTGNCTSVSKHDDDLYFSLCELIDTWERFDENFYAEDFDNALAGLINNLWQSLTEDEKQQVKGILE